MKNKNGITLITLVITIILLIILVGVTLNLTLGENGLISRTKDAKEKYEIAQIKENVELEILNLEAQWIKLGQKLTIEDALQEMVESNTFDSIDKEEGIGNIGEYEVKLKYDENGNVVVEYVQKATGVRITYTLYPASYTKEDEVDILLKVQGKVKSITKPDGLIVYPQKEVVGVDYYVTANGTYKFIIENEEGKKQEKNVIVDIIDKLAPKDFEITAENTRTGLNIIANTEDSEADGTSVCSGIGRYEYFLKKEGETEFAKYDTGLLENMEEGTYSIYVIAYDRAENEKKSNTITAEVETWIEIWNEQELRDIANNLTRNYILMANIELTDTWTAIGDNRNQFTGKLEGNNYKITNINNGSTTSNYQGLFGYMGSGAKVSNLTLEGEITGGSYTGMLAGYNYDGTIKNIKVSGKVTGNGNHAGGLIGCHTVTTGTIENCYIENCYSEVDVTGNTYVGGLVGETNRGTIRKCASSGTVTGTRYMGGLVGQISNNGIIENAYSTGAVTGKQDVVGGLVGMNGGTITNAYTISAVSGASSVNGLTTGVTVTNCYWIPEKAGVQTSALGIETTIDWLINKANLEDKWDFEETWGIEDGSSLPYLNGLPIPEAVYVIEQGYVTFDGGSGTEEDPYIITTEAQLNKIRYGLKLCYKLGANIKLTDTWIPIGDNTNQFTGKLEGNNYKITNINNGSTTSDYQGLFGYMGSGAKVSNLTLEGEITGGANTGMLAGDNHYGTIENIKVSGKVTGSANQVGGLVGQSCQVTIENCYSGVEVTGQSNVGGLVGYSSAGTITNSYSTGTVTGKSSVGGLVGNNSGTIENSYSTGTITGNADYVGGLVGYNRGYGATGEITNCYSDGDVTTQGQCVGGLVGFTGYSTITNCHSNGTVTGKNNVGGLIGQVGEYSTLVYSYSTCIVNGTGSLAGGLVGHLYGGCTLECSYSTGAVTGNETVGGLVGGNSGTIENSYSTGPVTGNKLVGGLVGNNNYATITNSYTLSAISGNSYVSGLTIYGTVTNSYWTSTKAGVTTSEVGTELTLEQMQTQSSYEGWDFETIWVMKEFPELRGLN